MDDEIKTKFEDATLQYLIDLETSLGTENVQVIVKEVIVGDQIKTQSDPIIGIQLLTKESALETAFALVMENGHDSNRRLDEMDDQSFLLVELSVDGEVTMPIDNEEEYSFGDRLFHTMENDIAEYAVRLASASSFFSKVTEESTSGQTSVPLSENKPEIIRSSTNIIAVAATIGALMGSLAILICGSLMFQKYRGSNSPTWNKPKPIQEVWPSFSSWNSPNDEEQLVRQPTSQKPKPFLRMRAQEASDGTSPYPSSINISRQDSFSTISNYGLHSQNMDAFGGTNTVATIEKSELKSKNDENSLQWKKPLSLRRVPNLSVDEDEYSIVEEYSNEIRDNNSEKKKRRNPPRLDTIDSKGEADIISIVTSSKKNKPLNEDNGSTDETEDDSYTCMITISVPPGYLGLILEKNKNNGPLVCSKVKPNSPLGSMVEKGDVIVSMDGVDVQRMSVYEFTNFLKQTMGNSKRVMKVVGVRRGVLKVPEGLVSL